MKTSRKESARMRVRFLDQSLARLVLEAWRLDRTLSVNILRGRITEHDASFELELTGDAQRIEEFVRQNAQWNTLMGAVPAEVA